jgi:hypothetical protein
VDVQGDDAPGAREGRQVEERVSERRRRVDCARGARAVGRAERVAEPQEQRDDDAHGAMDARGDGVWIGAGVDGAHAALPLCRGRVGRRGRVVAVPASSRGCAASPRG